MRLRVSVTGILLALCLGIPAQHVFAAKVKKNSESLRRHISLNIQMRNLSPALLPAAGLSIYGPIKKTAAQECVSLTANYPFKKTLDAAGNQLLQFDFKDFPAFENRIITLQAEVALRDELLKTSEKEAKQYLQPELHIESESPEITALAAQLKKRDGLATAHALYSWVAENISYSGYNKNPRGAVWTLRNRRGDCTEYMHLFIALSRAAGIPARGVTGFASERNGRLQPESFHDWAEFYSDGTWQLADPQMKNFMQNQRMYLAFKLLSDSDNKASRTFNLFKADGEGLKAVMVK